MLSGDVLAQFKIVKKLGEGGMGEVYLAEDTKLNRQVALKTLRDDYFSDQDRRDRFEREAKTAAQIQQANVMAIYDIGVAQPSGGKSEIHYIVMEYVKGQSLGDFLTVHSNDVGKLIRVSEKIATGLAAAHKLNIVHRDIKPENIIVDEQEEPKILDFGLAKPMAPLQTPEQAVSGETVKANLTKIGTVIGTVAYMSPEQARGETVDTRSDIFSFGVLLYKMFTGQMPFTGQSQVSILAKILETKQPPPREHRSDIDPEIERIIDKCLQKDANERYQDTRDLVIDLRNLRRQYDSGVSSTVSGVKHQEQFRKEVQKEVSRSRRKRIMIALPIVVILLALNWLLFHDKGPLATATADAKEYSLAILGFENKTGDPQFDWLETGLPEILMTDLAQGQMMNIISQRRLLEAMGSSENSASSVSYEDQVNAAKKLGAVNVMSGTIYKLGDKFRIDARLEDVKTGRVIMGEKVIGDDAFAIVDSLTSKIAASLNMEEVLRMDRNVSQLTTSNPEAYRYYHTGLNALLSSIWDEATENFEKAIAVDSTFALAYMRLGMVKIFQGRMPDAAPYFAQAKQLEANMPIRDRNLLDVYSDLWLRQQFDDAFVKIKTLVDNYPEDIEARSIYALLVWSFAKDTTGAFQQLEEVYKIDPKFQLALGFSAYIHLDLKEYDKAIEVFNRIKEYHPDSPTPDLSIANIYTRMGQHDKAKTAYEEYYKRFPDDAAALTNLCNNAIRRRDFAKADFYAEELARKHGQDPYDMNDYFEIKANLANWQGKFRSAMGYRISAAKQMAMTNDSSQFYNSWETIAVHYEYLGFPDSAIHYLADKYEFAGSTFRVNHWLVLIAIDPTMADSLRPMMQVDLNNMRTRLPAQLQPLGDKVGELYDALGASDTAKMISVYDELDKTRHCRGDAARTIATLAAFSGQYQKAYDLLTKYLAEGGAVTSGLFYPYTLYIFGIANEGLGKTTEAVKLYQEALSYWKAPEIEIPAIKDMKKRLARLGA
ncbi:MAG: protein kinase [bacterium]|nr:protein kinase [bacterium]